MVGKITAGTVSVRGNSALRTDRGDCTLALIKIVEENKQSTQELHWYALRVFRNRINGIKAQIETSGRETYRPMKVVDAVEGGALHYKEVALIPALLFLKSDLTYVKELRYKNFGQLMVYTGAATTEPAAIPDNQMEAFMKATSAYGNKDVEVLVSISPKNYPFGFKDIVTHGDFPIVWTNKKYRMVYLNMGHGDEAFIDATQNLLFTNAFRWVACENAKKRR